MMKYISAIKYVFSEPEWVKKLLIPGFIGLIPFVGIPYIFGWTMQILQNTIQNKEKKLPKAFSAAYLSNGLSVCAGFFLYYIPMLALFGVKNLFLRLIQGFLPIEFTSVIDKILGMTFSGIRVAYLVLFLLIVPYILVVFSRDFSFRSFLDLRSVYVFCKSHLSDLIPLTIMLCILILFAAFGTSLLIVGAGLTLPYACAVFARLLGEDVLISEIDSSLSGSL